MSDQAGRDLDPFERELVRAASPDGARIVTARRCLDWSGRPYPVRVTVEMPAGERVAVILKGDRDPHGVRREAGLYPLLSSLGLPVPRVLAGPAPHPDKPQAGDLVVYQELPGEPLPFCGQVTLAEIDGTCELLFDAVDRMHALTAAVAASALGASLPRTTLTDELVRHTQAAAAWLDHDIVRRAVAALGATVPSVTTPLAFSNGDYNTWNFLHRGGALTGFLDFALAGFSDPYLGFGKFVVWSFDDHGWGAGRRAGLVERYLYRHDVSRSQFAVRLALACLRDLGASIPRTDESDRHGQHVLALLERCTADLRG